MIYLSGGTVSLSSNSYINYFTEEADFWYNTSIICNPDDFEIGINYVLIRFLHDNYSSATFSFQLLINQIEINTETVDFEDTKEVLPGEAITLLIQLTEAGSGYPIENATISYSWEFGIGEFTYLGSGIYGLNLTIPLNARGIYRFNLIISTDVIDYKASQYSFIIDVGEITLPPIFLWIILAGSAIAIAVLGALSLRSYVILPRKRKKEAELLKRTQRFKDMQNIQAIVVIHRQSGIPVYTKSFSILEHQKKELFSGFIQAITTIGEEIVGKKGTQEKPKKPTDVAIFEGLIELDFKYFYCLICDVEEIRLVAILREKASQRLKKQIANLSSAIKLELSDLFSSWDGNLDVFDKVVPPIISGHLELFYKEAFILAHAEYIANIKKETEFSTMETRILNVIYSVAKNKTEFYLEPVMETVHEPNKDLVIDALEQLIEKKVIIPRKS